MSTTDDTSTHRPTTGDDRVDALESKLDVALDRIDELEATVEKQEQEIGDLREELDSRAAVRWGSTNIEDIDVESQEGISLPIGRILRSKVGKEDNEYETLKEDIWKLKTEGVDTEDLVGLTADADPALPIEDTIAALRSDVREDPSANKARASLVFQAFGGRASSTKGGKLVLKSPDVRSILEDPEKGDMNDVNNNTVRRTMWQCAKLTSPEADPKDRDTRDPRNLITIEDRDGNLALVADRDEWEEFLEEVAQRHE